VRVAKEGIVTFPNFANWRNRLTLGIGGGMPKSKALPYEWYDTPNIHLTTMKDFVELCRQEEIAILEMVCMPEHWLDKLLLSIGLRNLGAAHVLVKVARESAGA
jgi:homoserine O-acetyltransferase